MASANIWLKLNTPGPRKKQSNNDSQPNPHHNHPPQPNNPDVRSQGVQVAFDNHGFDICHDNDKESRHDLPTHDLDRPKEDKTKGSKKVLSKKRHSDREADTSVGRSEDEHVKEELSVANHDGTERRDNESEEAATTPSQRGSEQGVSNSENPNRRGKEVTFTIQDLGRPGDRGDDTTRVGREENENETTVKLRRDVALFFMDPFSKMKFKVKKRCCIYCPVKLIVQILKICFISGQMVQFGKQRSEMVEFFARTDTALKHLVLKDWSADYETMTYPPATGPFAVYTVDHLLDSIQYTWEKYYSLPATWLATISLLPDSSTGQPLPVRLCNKFVNYEQFPNGTYIVRSGEESYCTDLVPLEGQVNYDIRAFLRQRNLNLTYSKLLDITLTFPFNTFHFNLMETQTGPTCFTVNVTVLFSNYKRSGQILISLRTLTEERTCTGRIMSQDVEEVVESVRAGSLVLNIIVMLVCLLSSCLCGRSLHRARILKQKVEEQYKKLQMSDCMQFVNLWYVLMIVGDACIIAGSIFKSLLEFSAISSSSSNSNACGMLLGLGGLMAWVGSLRYLDFFKGFSVLIVTMKEAFSKVMRFMVCALVMYMGFLFCGWLVLGPYHVKFRHFSTAFECLFSLVNGDDMFGTFAATQSEDTGLWFFSRVYLYSFISLFVFCVLSLFISLFTETYDTLQTYFKDGFPKTSLHRFLEQYEEDVENYPCKLCCDSFCERCQSDESEDEKVES